MRKKILLVDDSATALMWEKMILRGGSYELLEATDGEQGVARAVAERPDLILMDVVMPKLGGLEACRRLRSHRATEGIPIIMVTTRSEAESMEEAYASGCSDYVTKPIDRVELLEKVRSILGD